jgi:hypothetical protein
MALICSGCACGKPGPYISNHFYMDNLMTTAALHIFFLASRIFMPCTRTYNCSHESARARLRRFASSLENNLTNQKVIFPNARQSLLRICRLRHSTLIDDLGWRSQEVPCPSLLYTAHECALGTTKRSPCQPDICILSVITSLSNGVCSSSGSARTGVRAALCRAGACLSLA